MESALAILERENQELRLENDRLRAKLERLREALKSPMELLGLQRQGLIPAPDPSPETLSAIGELEKGTCMQDYEDGIEY